MPPQNDSLLGMLSNYLEGQWSAREEETGRPMGVQNLAALSALEFLKPPPMLDESGNINPEALEMIVMGSIGQRAPGKQPEFIRKAKQSIDKLRSTYAHKKDRRNRTYLTLREMYSEKNLKHIVNKLPSIAAVTAAQELISQPKN